MMKYYISKIRAQIDQNIQVSDMPVSDMPVSDMPVSDVPAQASAVTHDSENNTSRRNFIKATAAGFIVGAYVPAFAKKATAATHGGKVLMPNAFVRVAPDNTVTVLVRHIEFGQGPFTGLATLVAEEMDAAWSQMRAEHSPTDQALYQNQLFGFQITGGSTSLPSSYLPLRQAGAQARALLVNAAADRWSVPTSELAVREGVIYHRVSNRRATFGDLARRAAKMKPPKTAPKVKSPEQFRLIGSDLPKLDTSDKTNGKARFTLDIYKPGMLTVVVAHPPAFGARLKTVNDGEARKVQGVVDVKTVPQGVAVYARNTYAAMRGRDALNIEWDKSQAETRSTETLEQAYRQRVENTGDIATDRGKTKRALSDAQTIVESRYFFPFLAHAPMEPLDAVVLAKKDRVDAWLGSQVQTVDHQVIAGIFDLPLEKVAVHTMLAGGSFGRRAQANSDFAAEAAHVAKAIGYDTPVKLVWSREDDIRGGFYRSMTAHKLRGGLDKHGDIVGWEQTIATASNLQGSPFEEFLVKDGIDATSVEGANDLPYAIDNLHVSLHTTEKTVPVLWWRSVGHTHTAYAVETFIDKLLQETGKDPVKGRLALLKAHPREAGVLRAAAYMADKAGKVPDGRAHGVAVHKSFGTYVAQIAEVSKGTDGLPKVHHVWCAVDCGIPINPNVIKAQMEGGIGYGLGAALYDEITLQDGGEVMQSNFHNYRSLRINEMPEVEVEIIKSTENPSGVGEPGVPPIAPAVANAWRRLTGQHIDRLPFSIGINQA